MESPIIVHNLPVHSDAPKAARDRRVNLGGAAMFKNQKSVFGFLCVVMVFVNGFQHSTGLGGFSLSAIIGSGIGGSLLSIPSVVMYRRYISQRWLVFLEDSQARKRRCS